MHRIGRTGRAGASGEALSLVCGEERGYLRDIEKLIGLKIPTSIVEGFEPDPNAPSKPVKKQQRQSKHSQNRKTEESKNSPNQKHKSRRSKRHRNRHRS